MDLKTLLACFMGRHHRYRLADVKFTTSAQTCEVQDADEPPRPKTPKKKAVKPKKPKTPKYKRLDLEKRIKIETLRDQGVRPSEIARIIGCARSTITNELKRNSARRATATRRSTAGTRDAGRSRTAWTSTSARRAC